jgi:putative ABC transport system substrate-binding protein
VVPVIGFVSLGSADVFEQTGYLAAFRRGLGENGYVEGQNVAVEYHWLGSQFDRLPALMADLVRRSVDVIATPTVAEALAAKAATSTIPIVCGVGEDPVKLGLVASLARPGGNATGINLFIVEVLAKRLGLLHELVPKAVRVAVLVNPFDSPPAEVTLRDVCGQPGRRPPRYRSSSCWAAIRCKPVSLLASTGRAEMSPVSAQ